MKSVLKPLAVAAIAATFASPAFAYEAGQWILRGGIGTVDPDSDNLTTGDTVFEVDSGTSLTLTATYMFTENWALDILAAWPFSHDIEANGVQIAETDHLPPTVSLQYHFLPDSAFKPYAGLGLNYTTFFSTDLDPAVGDDLDLDDSFGFAAQIGADIELADRWLLNIDLRYINIESDASVDGADLGTVDINPFVYSINVGYRF